MITIDRRDLVPLYLSLLASLVVTQAASPPRGCSLVTTQSPIPTRLTSVWPSPCTTRWHSLHHAIPHFHYEYVSPATRREMKAASNVEVDEAASRSQSRARFSFRKYPPTTAKDAPSVTPSECTAAAAANTKRVDHHNCRHNMVATALRGGGALRLRPQYHRRPCRRLLHHSMWWTRSAWQSMPTDYNSNYIYKVVPWRCGRHSSNGVLQN